MESNSSLVERFFRYVRLNTQSDPASVNFPSSAEQLRFGEMVVKELKEIGITEVKQDEYGYVIAEVPSNTNRSVPTLLFCTHFDTSPDCEATNVEPVLHKNYQGGDIMLPSEPSLIISPKDFPELLKKIGMDIITSNGKTLLGADNKAGVAELVEAAKHLANNYSIRHGRIILLFVPDEEIGKDILHLNTEELKADFGYTIDGHDLGSINDETFCVANIKLEIHGHPMHTGAGGALMENSLRIASEIIHDIPLSVCSELSGGRKGFIHISAIEGKMKSTNVTFQLRAFEENELKDLAGKIKEITEKKMLGYPRSAFSFSFELKDKNIHDVLKRFPFVCEFAAEAMGKAGIEAKIEPLRGATTGTGLTAKGIPTANLFTGQHANHSRMEWICVQDMQKAVESILNICAVWEEKGDGLFRV
jgi:tripeptide aminopeptidase